MQPSKTIKKRVQPRKWLWPFLLAFCLLFFLVDLIMPDSGFSQSENRILKSFPSISINSLVDGSTGQELEEYTQDQLVGRSLFFHANYLFRKALGQSEIEGVYLGNGMLYETSTPEQQEIWEANIKTIRQFMNQSGLPCHMMIVPNSGQVQPDHLPLGAPKYTEYELIDSIYAQAADVRTISLEDVFAEYQQDYIYYKTDHHWTSYGAGLAISELLSPMNFALSDFDSYQVSDSFQGALSNLTGSFLIRDDMEIYVSRNNPDYVVTWADGSKTTSVYDTQALDQKDQYQLFLGLNQGIVTIDTLADSDRSLLILKDSYANNTIQFLLPYFRNITVVDPRYYYEDLDFVLSNNQITDVVFLFGYNTFVADPSLQDVLNTYEEGLDANEEQNREEEDEGN